MPIIADYGLDFHPPSLPAYRHHILYVGNDPALSECLRETLRDCRIVGAPSGDVARILIRSINYSLLLFAPELPDMTGKELAQLTRALPHRERTPMITIWAGARPAKIVETIARLLDTSDSSNL